LKNSSKPVESQVYFEIKEPFDDGDHEERVPAGLYQLEYTFSDKKVCKIRCLRTRISYILPIKFLKTVQIKNKDKLDNIKVLYGGRPSR